MLFRSTIINNIPEGTTKAELAAKLSAKGYNLPMDDKPKDESQAKAFTKAAAESVIPTAAALPGAVIGSQIGEAVGALGGPLAPITIPAGGVIGGFAGGYLGGEAGEKLQKKLGETFTETKEALGFGEKQREAERKAFPGTTLAGEIAPAIASLKVPTEAFEKGVNSFMAKMLYSKASPAQKEALVTAKDWGLKVKPSQVQEGANQTITSTAKNQTIMNQKASEATGYKADYIDDKFLYGEKKLDKATGEIKESKGVFTKLGDQYNEIYTDPSLGKKITLDVGTAQTIKDAVNSGLVSLKAPIKDKVALLVPETRGALLKNVNVPGSDFQGLMSQLKTAARKETDGIKRSALYDLIDDVHESMKVHNPSVAARLEELNPKYRAAITLEKARQGGVIDVNGNIDAYDLGKMLAKEGRQGRSNPLTEVGKRSEEHTSELQSH